MFWFLFLTVIKLLWWPLPSVKNTLSFVAMVILKARIYDMFIPVSCNIKRVESKPAWFGMSSHFLAKRHIRTDIRHLAKVLDIQTQLNFTLFTSLSSCLKKMIHKNSGKLNELWSYSWKNEVYIYIMPRESSEFRIHNNQKVMFLGDFNSALTRWINQE